MKPDVRITWNEGFAIAYQVVGNGMEDVVYLPGRVSNVDLMWDVPPYARFLERLASISRLIAVDRRGVGCSDRLPPGSAATLEEMAEDVLAAMDAASSPGATVLAVQDTVFTALILAASYPRAVRRLILFCATPSWRRSEDLPDEVPAEAWDANRGWLERVTSVTETVEGYVRENAPSLMGDERSKRALVSLFMNNQGLGAEIAEDAMLSRVDLRWILPSITAPTIVLRRADDEQPASSSRYLAEHVEGAEYVEIPGDEPLPWLGDQDPLFAEIERFLGVERPAPLVERRLATVLFTDIVGSTERQARLGDRGWRELVEQHHSVVREGLAHWHGVENDTAGDGFYATFDGPARAVRCASELVGRLRDLGIEIRAGIHAGECEVLESKCAGLTVSIGARVAAEAAPSQILVSSTVKDLVVGSGLSFEDAGEHELKGVPDRWRLYRVVGA